MSNGAEYLLLICIALLTAILAHTWLGRKKLGKQVLQLADQLAHYQVLFDCNPSPMYVYDVQTLKLLAANQRLFEQYDYSSQELIGLPVLLLHAEIEREAVRQVITGLVSSKETQYKRRWLHRKRNGETFPVEVFSQPLLYAGLEARLVVARDIRNQVAAEEDALSHKQFRESLLESLPVPVFYKNREGRYLGLNDAFVRMFGQPREHFLGKTAWDIAPPEMAARYQSADDALYPSAETIQVYSAQVSTSTNGVRDVIFNKAVFFDTKGAPAGLIGTVMDVTQQVATEKALRESRAEMAQILANSPLPIFAINADHELVVWNPACERNFGVPARDMLGTRRAWAAVYASERPVLADLLLDGAPEAELARHYGTSFRRSPFNQDALEAEGFFPLLGEKGRWLFFTASLLHDDSGKVVGAIETLFDITERKEAEQHAQELNEVLEERVAERSNELRKAMKQLVQTEKLAALGSLVAGVAHELNTPLGNVLTVATALRDQTDTFSSLINSGNPLRRSVVLSFLDNCQEATAIIEQNSRRSAELIGNFKQVAVDQTSARRRDFDLAEVLNEMLSALTPLLRSTSHRINIEIPAGIHLESYPGPLEQVLSNLIMNSLLHGFEGMAQGEILIQAELQQSADGTSDAVCLRYRDNGIGMAENTVRQAFDPFYTTKLGKGGSGLGLYLVYNLVTAVLGGTIQLNSRPGEGVLFDIVFPVNAPLLVEDEV
ncbi:MAG: PAS domain S-box protein [Zoogloeaceae bacterium]|nr:PAS domain S-box protein [Zoogloeaceae bacterium]